MKNFQEIQSTVTAPWLSEQMKLHGKQGGDFKETLGVTAQAISEILNETPGRPQRQSRVVLYLYFTFCSRITTPLPQSPAALGLRAGFAGDWR